MPTFSLPAIGWVRSALRSREDAPQQGPPAGGLALIEVDAAWREGLTGLTPGRHLWVIYHFHQAGPPRLLVHPRRDPDRPLTGVFNTRAPCRPAALGLTLVRLEKIEPGGLLTVRGLEALDGSPVLDIKPYVPGLDRPPGEEP